MSFLKFLIVWMYKRERKRVEEGGGEEEGKRRMESEGGGRCVPGLSLI